MDTENSSKINQLLQSQPSGTVFTAEWMTANGYSLDLQRQYRKSNWFESIGNGAMKRVGENVSLVGALYSLQKQLGLAVHIGGISALGMQGKAHYLAMGEHKTSLFCPTGMYLPKWFLDYEGWKDTITLTHTDFLPATIETTAFQQNSSYQIQISSPARAMLECLYSTPAAHHLTECYEIMEGLNNLRPQSVQVLLENCNSVKVKRLFLFMADKSGHKWFKYLKMEQIDLGKGKRSIASNGVYNAKYKITVPKELMKDEEGI
ncbi:transcriptional regulator with AbiEi antitoxin N-terminal domain [bacterium A37T11]|nr:transcriptional regulator with AbiEi antitoxin N-terminal domain [bacterium A37T11]